MLTNTIIRRSLLALAAVGVLGWSAFTGDVEASPPPNCPNTTCIGNNPPDMCQYFYGEECGEGFWCGPGFNCCGIPCSYTT